MVELTAWSGGVLSVLDAVERLMENPAGFGAFLIVSIGIITAIGAALLVKVTRQGDAILEAARDVKKAIEDEGDATRKLQHDYQGDMLERLREQDEKTHSEVDAVKEDVNDVKVSIAELPTKLNGRRTA